MTARPPDDDQRDLDGITSARIANLVAGVADGSHRLSLAVSVADSSTRLLVERLVELVWFYASFTAAGIDQTVEEHLSAVLNELDLARQHLRGDNQP